MKKTLTMILAAATVASMSAMAMAQEVNVTDQIDAPVRMALEEAAEDVTSGSASSEEAAQPAAPQGDPSGLVFGADKNQDNAVIGETILEPGVEYRFPVSMVFEGKAFPMKEEMLKDMRLTYSKLSSTAVKTFKIEAYKDGYYLTVELKDSIPNEIVDVKYNVKLVRRDSKLSVFSQEVKFQYGYGEHNDDKINGLDKGDEIEISNASPVITKEQFERIAKVNDYRNVTLVGPSWTFEVNVTDEGTKNLLSNNAGTKEILSRFPEQEIKFFNFPDSPSFSAAGKIALDVDDIVDDFEEMHAYRFANGKLYALKTTLNEDTNMLEFRTNKLDSFIVTDKEIKDGFTVKDEVLGSTTDEENTAGKDNAGSTDKDDGKKNPSTGASDIGSAVAAAMASLAAAGFAAFKIRA